MAKKHRVQILIEYSAAAATLKILGLLPRRVAVRCSMFFARMGFYLAGRLRKIALRNLEITFPGLSENERREIALRSFENMGRMIGETGRFNRATRGQIEQLLDKEAFASFAHRHDEMKREGRGIVIITGHLGNWELSLLAFSALHSPMSFMARPLDNPLLDDIINKLRTRFGNDAINKIKSARKALSVLRNGGVLGILADVNTQPQEGVFVKFFGQDACTNTGPAVLALRTNSVLYPTFCVWDEEIGKYRFVHGPAIEPVVTGDRKRDIIETTAAYTSEIEKFVRAYPDQWMWVHRRWKTRPTGEADLY